MQHWEITAARATNGTRKEEVMWTNDQARTMTDHTCNSDRLAQAAR